MKPLRAADFEPDEAVHTPAPTAAAPAIRVTDVSKAYKLYREPRDLLWEALTGRNRHTEKVVLQDISFEIPKGEVVGIIGANGAGKSTLLKMIAGTLQPSTGRITVDGKIAAILELGTGFNPNYSGRENVILSGMLRGMSEQDIRRKFDSIVAFSGLEAVIDQPFHTYSSGMQARLAFATAVSVDADIIIIDEALAAGDVRFTSKSLRRIREISESGITCLFVSHVTYQIMQLCSRAIWIDNGRMRMDGPAIDVVRAYEYEMHRLIAEDRGDPAPAAPDPGPTAVAALAARPEAEPDSTIAAMGAEFLAGTADSEAEPVEETGERSGEHASGVAESLETFPVEQALAPLGQPQAAEPGKPSALAQRGPPSEPETTPEGAAGSCVAVAQPVASDEGSATSAPLEGGDAGRGEGARLEPAPTSHSGEDDATGQYRMTGIELLDAAGRQTKVFRFGDVLRLRVAYEKLGPHLPDLSCGLAITFERTSDFEPVMHFDGKVPLAGAEIGGGGAGSRQVNGRKGVIEARMEPLQLCAGEYHLSLGIRSDRSGTNAFDEYVRHHCLVTVLPSGFPEPSVFYPLVRWSSGHDQR